VFDGIFIQDQKQVTFAIHAGSGEAMASITTVSRCFGVRAGRGRSDLITTAAIGN
jgi:hypothetical protein